jgi:hypothetical protein
MTEVWDLDMMPRRRSAPRHVGDHDVLKRKKIDTVADLGA